MTVTKKKVSTVGIKQVQGGFEENWKLKFSDLATLLSLQAEKTTMETMGLSRLFSFSVSLGWWHFQVLEDLVRKFIGLMFCF